MLLRHLPRDCATARAVLGDDAGWDLHAHLLASTFDALNVANWQRSGGKGRRPRPLPRPGRGDGPRQYGHSDRDPDQIRAYLKRFAPS